MFWRIEDLQKIDCGGKKLIETYRGKTLLDVGQKTTKINCGGKKPTKLSCEGRVWKGKI